MSNDGERIARLETRVDGHDATLTAMDATVSDHERRLTKAEVRLTLMVVASAAIGGVLGSGIGDAIKAIFGK